MRTVARPRLNQGGLGYSHAAETLSPLPVLSSRHAHRQAATRLSTLDPPTTTSVAVGPECLHVPMVP